MTIVKHVGQVTTLVSVSQDLWSKQIQVQYKVLHREAARIFVHACLNHIKHLGYLPSSCGFVGECCPVLSWTLVFLAPPQAFAVPHFPLTDSELINQVDHLVLNGTQRASEINTWVGVCCCFLLAAGVFRPGLPPALLCRSLSLWSRMVCRVVLYSKEKLLTVRQKSSALVSLTIALE